jgi:hypothetical protein
VVTWWIFVSYPGRNCKYWFGSRHKKADLLVEIKRMLINNKVFEMERMEVGIIKMI